MSSDVSKPNRQYAVMLIDDGDMTPEVCMCFDVEMARERAAAILQGADPPYDDVVVVEREVTFSPWRAVS